MKHTPGPWRITDEDPPRILATDERATVIAITTAPRSNESNMADAYLIAAAPELLASLKWAMGHLDEVGGTDNPDFVAAREAIAKAEGREP